MQNSTTRSHSEHSRLFALIFFALSILVFCSFIGMLVFRDFMPKPLTPAECVFFAAIVAGCLGIASYLWDKAEQLEEEAIFNEEAQEEIKA